MPEDISEINTHQLFVNCLPDGVEMQFIEGTLKKCSFPDKLDELHIDDDYIQRHAQKVSGVLGNAFPQLQIDLKTEISEQYAFRLLAGLIIIHILLQKRTEQNPLEGAMQINDQVSQIQFPSFLAEFAAKHLGKLHPAWMNTNQADIDKAYSVEAEDGDAVIQIHDMKALQSDTTNKNIEDDISMELAKWSPQDIIELLQDQGKQVDFIAKYPRQFITHWSTTPPMISE